MVTYKYDYIVEGKTYTAEVSSNKLPDNVEFEVTYLPGKPEVVERGNICSTYESIKNNKSSSFLMYLGIGLFFIGIIVEMDGIKETHKKEIRPVEIATI